MVRKSQKGFTLVEVIISMAVLVMLSLPLLTFFANATQTGVKASQIQGAVEISDSIMEELKTYPDVASMLKMATNSSISLGLDGATDPDSVSAGALAMTTYQSNGWLPGMAGSREWINTAPSTTGGGKYYLERRNIPHGNHYFDARITIDTEKYWDTADSSQDYNHEELPKISLVSSDDSVSALSSPLDADTAKIMLQSQIQVADDDGSGTPDIRDIPNGNSSSSDYVSPMSRKTIVDIQPSGVNNAQVRAWEIYSCEYKEISGGAIETATYEGSDLLNTTVSVDDLKNVYLFFNHTDLVPSTDAGAVLDTIQIQKSSALPLGFSPEFYLIYQKTASGAINYDHWSVKIENYTDVNRIHTNIKSVNVLDSSGASLPSSSLYEIVSDKKNADRLAQITVEIYDGGYLKSADYADHLRNTFSSTVSLIN